MISAVIAAVLAALILLFRRPLITLLFGRTSWLPARCICAS